MLIFGWKVSEEELKEYALETKQELDEEYEYSDMLLPEGFSVVTNNNTGEVNYYITLNDGPTELSLGGIEELLYVFNDTPKKNVPACCVGKPSIISDVFINE